MIEIKAVLEGRGFRPMFLVNPPAPNFIDFTTGDRPSCAALFAALGAIV
ncbi:MAG: hypothetical protein WBL95_10430 [Microcoleus sp.]